MNGTGDLLADLRGWQAKIDALPPIPRGVITDHRVPYGRAFKQWDTNGDLWLWVNRGEIEDIPRARPHDALFAMLPPSLTGIRVYNEDPRR